MTDSESSMSHWRVHPEERHEPHQPSAANNNIPCYPCKIIKMAMPVAAAFDRATSLPCSPLERPNTPRCPTPVICGASFRESARGKPTWRSMWQARRARVAQTDRRALYTRVGRVANTAAVYIYTNRLIRSQVD